MHIIRARLSACLAIAALASGCFFDSALDATPQQPVDPRLLGAWKCTDSSSTDSGAILVARRTDNTFELLPQGEAPDADRAIGFVSVVAGATVMNVKVIHASPQPPPRHPWVFVLFRMQDDGSVSIMGSADSPFPDPDESGQPTSTQLRTSLAHALADPGRFYVGSTCTKQQ
jgi:hypothetical protein